MIILQNIDPKFVITKDIELLTSSRGSIFLEQDEPISVYKSEDFKNLYLGDISGDILQLTGSVIIEQFLDLIYPSNFELTGDTDLERFEGSEYLKPMLLSVDMTGNDKMARISLVSEEIVSCANKILINSIIYS